MSLYAPWIYSGNRPDTFSLEQLVSSPRFAGKQNEAFAVELFKYLCDPEEGIYHYCAVEDRFRSREVHDPLQILNSFGFCICHIHAHITAQIFRAAGYKARIACIRGHEGTEVWYDDGWHYFDMDLRGYSRRHPPEQHIIASREDMFSDPTIVTQQQNPSEPIYYIDDRPPELIGELVKAEPTYLRPFDECSHSLDFVLRPGESIRRTCANQGRYIMTPNYAPMWRTYWKEPGPGGPKDRWNTRRNYSNGCWHYEPQLTREYADIDKGVAVIENLSQTDRGIEVAPGESGSLVFDFTLPYPVAGIPDEQGIFPPSEGALFNLHAIRQRPGDNLTLKLSYDDGKTFETVWGSHAIGKSEQTIDLTPHLHNRYHFQLMIELTGGKRDAEETGGMTLLGFSADLWFMHSPWVMPLVSPGETVTMHYHAFDKYGLPTRKLNRDLDFINQMDQRSFEAELHEALNLKYDPSERALLFPADAESNDGNYSLVYKLTPPITGTICWLYATAVWEGHKPGEEPTAVKIEYRDGADGTWIEALSDTTDEHPQGWHTIVGTEIRLSGNQREACVRFTAGRGIDAVRLTAHYIPDADGADYSNPQFEIIHEWREGNDLCRHAEAIPAGANEHTYLVSTGATAENVGYVVGLPSVSRNV